MESNTASNAASYAESIAQFGSQLSRVIHNYVALEDPHCKKLAEFLGCLTTTVHTLDEVSRLLNEHAALKVEKSTLFAPDGIDYVAILAEECSVALCRAKSVIDGGARGRERRRRLSNPRDWISLTSVDDKGQRTFVAPTIDETELFQQLDDTRWYRPSLQFALGDIIERLKKLQMLLLLVVQVVAVRGMTIKSPSGCGDLKSIFQCCARVERAADLANITNSRRRSRSSSLSSDFSDSDSGSDISERPGRKRQSFKPVKFNPPPPPSRVPATFGGPGGPSLGPPPPPPLSNTIGGVQIIDVHLDSPKDTHPPSYTETASLKTDSSLANGSMAEKSGSSEMSCTTTCVEKASKTEEDAGSKKQHPMMNKPLLLSSSSGVGMKFKSLFRSKTSLEAEMQKTLAGDNASLTAYLIQKNESFKVPHSAFHSLEYTHMRTILSQLQDNTWFKAFSDLRDVEHDAVDKLGRKMKNDQGKWMKRELVVLKVLQQNRLNGWMRVLESCIGLEECFLPQHENFRIILAIVRNTECEQATGNDAVIIPGRQKYLDSNGVERPGLSRIGDFKIDIVNAGRPPPPPPPGGVPRPVGAAPPTSWNGLCGPAPPPGLGFPSYLSCQRADVTPQILLNETSCREILTTFRAYTFRPVPAYVGPTHAGPIPKPQWSRCFITQEHDSAAVLQERVAAFNRRGDSIIDLKMQLIEPQSAQLSRLIDESNRLERDGRFEHKIVELSMVDRERGMVRRQTRDLHVDCIHVILQRSPKENLSAMQIHKAMNTPIQVHPFPPAPPPPRGPPMFIKEIVRHPIKRRGGRRARSVSSYWSSEDSDSDSTVMTDSSLGSRSSEKRTTRKSKKAKSSDSDSDSEDDEKPRWKKDPVILKIDKIDKKRDIVELLLERWTTAGEGKAKVEVKVEDAKKADKKKKGKASKKDRRRNKKYHGDSDSTSLADD